MTLYIASDHAGFEAKKLILAFLTEHNFLAKDLGSYDTQPVDYPDYAQKLCNAMTQVDDLGILICGTGIGVSIAANRFKHIRAATCHNETEAYYSRAHNDANVLCLGSRIIGIETIYSIILKFLTINFTNIERHIRRIRKLC